MHLYSVAINTKYEVEAQRLNRSMGNKVTVFTNADLPVAYYDPLINGLHHKSNFANYINDVNGSVIFMDADMFTLKDNPFADWENPNADMAYVPYQGMWHLPDAIRQSAIEYLGHKVNSGFLWFKDLETAKTICTEWNKQYLERTKLYDVSKGTSKYEYDEWALMIALQKLKVKRNLLNIKWNDWALSTEEEIKGSDSVFFQSHEHLNIV